MANERDARLGARVNPAVASAKRIYGLWKGSVPWYVLPKQLLEQLAEGDEHQSAFIHSIAIRMLPGYSFEPDRHDIIGMESLKWLASCGLINSEHWYIRATQDHAIQALDQLIRLVDQSCLKLAITKSPIPFNAIIHSEAGDCRSTQLFAEMSEFNSLISRPGEFQNAIWSSFEALWNHSETTRDKALVSEILLNWRKRTAARLIL
jgi:hypothetical protein